MNAFSSIRYHGLDALRAFAMLLGIALHGGMAYIGGFLSPEERAGMPIDPSSSLVILLVIVWIHTWRMQIFFLMAGFFAHLVVERRGLRSFVKNRFRRIVIPFVLGMLIILPLTLLVFIYAAWQSGTLDQPSDDSGSAGIPLIHLWFLYYLMGFYLITVAVCWIAARRPGLTGRILHRADRVMRAIMESRWRILWLVLPTMLLQAAMKSEDVELFAPNLSHFIYQGLFFVFGWLLYRQPDLLTVLRRRRIWLGYVVAGTLIVMPLWLTVSETVSERNLIYTGLYSMQTWLMSLGLIGMCDALNSRPRRWVQYLTDAAYWVYLLHMPVVILLNVWLIHLPWAALPKFALVCAISALLLLVTYHWWVRYTFIGNLLNGPRQRRLSSQT